MPRTRIAAATASGEITPAGKSTIFSVDGFPGGLTAGPDGAVWFTDGGQIGRITTSGQASYFAIPDYYSGGFPLSVTADFIAAGSDGNLWFTASDSDDDPLIGRITPGGSITFFPLTPTTSNFGGTVDPGASSPVLTARCGLPTATTGLGASPLVARSAPPRFRGRPPGRSTR